MTDGTFKIARQFCHKSEAREFTTMVSVAQSVDTPNLQDKTGQQKAVRNP
jgi:hypothetical protein